MFRTQTLSPIALGSICQPHKMCNVTDSLTARQSCMCLHSPTLSKHPSRASFPPQHPFPCTPGFSLALAHLAGMLWSPSFFQIKQTKALLVSHFPFICNPSALHTAELLRRTSRGVLSASSSPLDPAVGPIPPPPGLLASRCPASAPAHRPSRLLRCSQHTCHGPSHCFTGSPPGFPTAHTSVPPPTPLKTALQSPALGPPYLPSLRGGLFPVERSIGHVRAEALPRSMSPRQKPKHSCKRALVQTTIQPAFSFFPLCSHLPRPVPCHCWYPFLQQLLISFWFPSVHSSHNREF